MSVTGHCGERGEMALGQSLRGRFEHFAGRKIVEVALPHRIARCAALAGNLPPQYHSPGE